jgi:hypothetical protein
MKEKILKFIKENVLEIILCLGLFFIILPSMIIKIEFGLYVLGLILVALSIYLTRR